MQAVSSAIESELPVLNLTGYERTTAFLEPENVRTYMQTLIARSETLLHDLRDPSVLAAGSGNLAESAHTLAGSAGLFSFQRLDFAARRYEQAVETASPEVSVCISQLIAAIETTLPEMQSRASA